MHFWSSYAGWPKKENVILLIEEKNDVIYLIQQGIHLKKISGMMFKTEKQLINKEGTFDKNLKWMHWKFLTFHELKSKKYHARFSDYEREVNESTSEDDSFLGDETEKDLKVMTFDEYLEWVKLETKDGRRIIDVLTTNSTWFFLKRTDNIVRFWGFHQSSICPQNFKMECNILKKGVWNNWYGAKTFWRQHEVIIDTVEVNTY